jgi:archaeosine synthase beta-subunit
MNEGGHSGHITLIDQSVLSLRGPRNQVDPWIPYSFFCEDERSATGEIVPVATIFLTNQECPWRCLMCDLWKNTLTSTVPFGAIPEQIEYALRRLPKAQQIKLYNSGSFFDKKAIPPEDYAAIAGRINVFENVIVESHPALINEDCLWFREMIGGDFEVAMGLETSHEEVLQKLNKKMTLHQFAEACSFLKSNSINVRAFILVKPPFLNEEEGIHWARRSIDFAFDCGVDVISLIPTRFGNGSLEALAKENLFSPPKLTSLQVAAEYGVALKRGRVFADLWDLGKFSTCSACFEQRFQKLQIINLHQQIPSSLNCEECGEKI